MPLPNRPSYCNDPSCAVCYPDLSCQECGHSNNNSSRIVTNPVRFRNRAGRILCRRCFDRCYWTCGRCDTMYRISEQGYCDCTDNDNDFDFEYNDDDDFRSDRLINDYSYKPRPIFNGEGPLYLGAEIEITTPYNDVEKAAQLAVDNFGDLAYLKYDGSISCGFEIVTHPMSYPWAIDNFPWKTMLDLNEMGCRAQESCGMHIHVSRDGFSSPSHIFRWMKLFYRNQRQIETIARRRSPQWAQFDREDRRRVKDYAKGRRSPNRYVAINTQNRETFELRVFASSLNPTEIQAAMGLATASVEYSRSLTANDILKGHGWEWGKFAYWVAQTPAYQPLYNEMEKYTCVS